MNRTARLFKIPIPYALSRAFVGRRRRGLTALAHRLVHDDCSGDRDVERGDLPGHGDAEEVIAGLFDEVVEAGSFAAEDETQSVEEVEVGVVGGSALVEADDPDVVLLHLLEGADEVGDAGDRGRARRLRRRSWRRWR